MNKDSLHIILDKSATQRERGYQGVINVEEVTPTELRVMYNLLTLLHGPLPSAYITEQVKFITTTLATLTEQYRHENFAHKNVNLIKISILSFMGSSLNLF